MRIRLKLEKDLEMAGKVFLIPSHGQFGANPWQRRRLNGELLSQAVEFTSDMRFWDIYESTADNRLDESMALMHKACLIALQELDNSTSVVSMKVEKETPKLILSERTWGQIYFDDKLVANFTHHKSYERPSIQNPHESMISWPENISPETVEFWGVSDWRLFFRQRIYRNNRDQLDRAIKRYKKYEDEVVRRKRLAEMFGPE
jgi:hypothetical protein